MEMKRPLIMDKEFKILFERIVCDNTDLLKGYNKYSQPAGKNNKNGLYCYYYTLNTDECFECKYNGKMYIVVSRNGIFLNCFKNKSCSKLLDYPIEYVKEYCPKMYANIQKRYGKTIEMTDEIKKDIDNVLVNSSQYRIAKFIFNIYKNTIRVDSVKNTEWYIFDSVRFIKSNIIDILISEDITIYFMLYKDILEMEMKDLDINMDKADLKRMQGAIKRKSDALSNIIEDLENITTKSKIIKQLAVMFNVMDPKFYELLDSNELLLGFNNGIYDFNTFSFRQGRADDYITFTTGYDYIEYNPSDIHTMKIMEFMSQIITDSLVLTYLFKVLGKALMGLVDEKFYIFVGIMASNGKSTLISFLQMALGDYMTAIDVSLITQNRKSSGNASPDVVRLKGKRLFGLQEPENNDKLKTGILKQFTGNDLIVGRELFKSPITFKLMGTMLLCCNELPGIVNFDGGVQRRIRVIEFNSIFKDHPNPNNTLEFKRDLQLSRKLELWKAYFMSILIHYCKLYHSQDFYEPQCVLEATLEYKNDNDKFLEFFEQCLVTDSKTFESTKDIYNNFSLWSIENYPSIKVPDVKELKRALKLKYGKENPLTINNIKYMGYKLRFNTKIHHNDDIIEFESMTLQDDTSNIITVNDNNDL